MKRSTLQFVEPMQGLLVYTLPEGPEWSYEIKLLPLQFPAAISATFSVQQPLRTTCMDKGVQTRERYHIEYIDRKDDIAVRELSLRRLRRAAPPAVRECLHGSQQLS